MRALVFVPLLALALPACMVGPDYAPPEIAAPEAWRDAPAAEVESLANVPWWKLFGDPRLQDLIVTALDGNKDLRIAAERVVEWEVEPLTLDEVRRVLVTAGRHRNRVRRAVALALGLRQGEALGLPVRCPTSTPGGWSSTSTSRTRRRAAGSARAGAAP